MYQTITHYAARPSLLKAGQINEITVDVEDYHYAVRKTDLTVSGHNGVLKFSHLFEGKAKTQLILTDQRVF